MMEFRGIQIDLARQPERKETLFSFIDFAARYGFNKLIFYIEGRIKTKSFPWPVGPEFYDADDIREIVAYAGKQSMEVVPVVSLFGHANIFLHYPELKHLAELRGGREGRFSAMQHVFCPSLQETRDFLTAYVAEVSALFPSEYFHVGFDEAWDIGYCDLCKERVKQEGQAGIFLGHLLFCHKLVHEKLGKKMIIWDDLYDIYPETLEKTPRDVILCSWHYDELVERPAGHCGGPRDDHFKMYDRLGFRYLFAPNCTGLRNIETFTDYARTGKPLGGILTSWEMERRFHFSELPAIAYAGLLWSEKEPQLCSDALQCHAMRDVVGELPEEIIRILQFSLCRQDKELSGSIQNYLRGPLTAFEYAQKSFIHIARDALTSMDRSVLKDALSEYILDDTLLDLRIEALHYELREVVSLLYARVFKKINEEKLQRRIERSLQEINDCRALREAQWEKWRSGLNADHLDVYFSNACRMLESAKEDSQKTKALLHLRFDTHPGRQDIFVRYEGSEEFEEVRAGFSASSFPDNFSCWIPLYKDEPVAAVRLEAWGYVGSEILFVEIVGAKVRYVPTAIEKIEGKIFRPEAILEDGRDACIFGDGEQSAREKFCNPSLAQKRNKIQILMRS